MLFSTSRLVGILSGQLLLRNPSLASAQSSDRRRHPGLKVISPNRNQLTSMVSKPTPAISVVMPVHNGLPYLSASIESILCQSFTDFELIILNDGSTDGSAEVLRHWALKDPRIQLLATDRKSGLSGSSNLLASKARAPLVARMDADDISHPDRLRRQWEVLEGNSAIVLVGTLSDGIDSDGNHVRPRDRWRLLRRSPYPPFPHGSVMFRRSIFEEVGGYSEQCIGWEEHELFIRMSRKGRIVVIPDVLYSYRYHVDSTTIEFSHDEAGHIAELRSRCIAEFRSGRDYQALLNGPPNRRISQRAALAALYTPAAMHLWAGHSPKLLASVVASPDSLWNPKRVLLLVWGAWAASNPASLRTVMRAIIRTRDFMAGFEIKDGIPYEWRFE
jgi:glycosyltransferase involved in cell wall biosynthesis